MPFLGHGWEIGLVLVIVLIIFGPGKLPELGNALGKGLREFRKSTQELSDGLRHDTSATANPSPAAAPYQPAAPYVAPEPHPAVAPVGTTPPETPAPEPTAPAGGATLPPAVAPPPRPAEPD